MQTPSGGDRPFIDRVARNFASGESISARIRQIFGDAIGGFADRYSPAAAMGGEIKLFSVTRDRINGRLTLGDAGLLFDSQVLGTRRPRATIRTLDQREMVDFRADDEALTIRFGGGAAISRTERAKIATLGAGPLGRPPVPERSKVATIQGDGGFVDEFFRSREYALLPELSYALGLAGATGHRYRPSLALHSLGLTAAGFLGVDPARPGVSYRMRLPPGLRPVDPRAFFDRLIPTECWSGPEEGPNLDGLPGCPGQGCESHPNRDNDCFGMCGAGCDCWSWICGDCCFHDFCADHDALLRQCEGAEDVALCLGSVIILPTWLLGCDHGWLPF